MTKECASMISAQIPFRGFRPCSLPKVLRSGSLAHSGNARKVVSEILEKSTGETLHFHTCKGWLDEWLAGKRGAVADKSIVKYEQVNKDFVTHLGERATLTLAAIGPKDIRSFRDALAKGGRSASTVNQTIRKVLSASFLAAMRLGYISTNPCAAVEALRDDSDAERDTFTEEQVAKLLKATDGDWKGAILCGYYTGLRLRDVSEMTWEAVNLEARTLRIKTRKTGSVLVLPLHDELATWLREQTRGIGKASVFASLAGTGTGGRHGLWSVQGHHGTSQNQRSGGSSSRRGHRRTKHFQPEFSLSPSFLRIRVGKRRSSAGTPAEARRS